MAAILTDGGHLHSIQILKNTTYVYMKTENSVRYVVVSFVGASNVCNVIVPIMYELSARSSFVVVGLYSFKQTQCTYLFPR